MEKNSERNSAAIATSLSATTGELAELYLSAQNGMSINKEILIDIRSIIKQQAMAVLILAPRMQDFDAPGFRGICILTSNRDLLFAGERNEVERMAYQLIKSRLAMLEPLIAVESSRRSALLIGAQSCPGFNDHSSFSK